MAAVRCKQSKVRFFWGALFGKTWREEDLFHPEALVQGRANHMLQQYKSSSQVGAEEEEEEEGFYKFLPHQHADEHFACHVCM